MHRLARILFVIIFRFILEMVFVLFSYTKMKNIFPQKVILL